MSKKLKWIRFIDQLPTECEPIMVSASGYRHMLYTQGPVRAEHLVKWLEADYKAKYWIYIKDM